MTEMEELKRRVALLEHATAKLMHKLNLEWVELENKETGERNLAVLEREPGAPPAELEQKMSDMEVRTIASDHQVPVATRASVQDTKDQG
jgi:hypothetical protein